MTHNDFIRKNNLKYVEFPGTGSALYQCMDLMRFYIRDVWGLDPYIIPRAGSAKQAFQACSSNNKIEKIYNTPTGVPQQGDLVFWGFYPGVTGWAGHVGIYDRGDVMNLFSFGQNYPTYTPCHIQRHSYKGVMGWVHKR